MIQPDLIMDVFDGNKANQEDAKKKGSNKIYVYKITFFSMHNVQKVKRIFSKSESGSLFWGCL